MYNTHAQIERKFGKKANGTAAIARVASEFAPDEEKEEGDCEDGGKDCKPPSDVCEKNERQGGK